MTTNSLIWIREAPTDIKSARKTQHARRSHKKSRSGCTVCKKRRVKCDECRPTCGQCRYRGTDCNYTIVAPAARSPSDQQSTTTGDDNSPPQTTTSDLSAEACLGLHVFSTSISKAVTQHAQAGLSSNSLAHFLQHFERTSYSTISSPTGQRILHDKIPRMLMSHPFLLHTVLAFSSSHLEYLARDGVQRGNLMMTAGYHTQQALKLYSERIRIHQCDKNQIIMRQTSGLEEMDALFAACIMLTSLFYHINEVELPRRSWSVSSPDSPDPLTGECGPSFDWLTNASGLTILMRLTQFQQRLGESIWLPFIAEAARVEEDKAILEKGPVYANLTEAHSRIPPTPAPSPATLPNIPKHLLALCLASANFPIYAPALTMLNLILPHDPQDVTRFGTFISFPSRLSPEFSSLLRRKQVEQVPGNDDTVRGMRCTAFADTIPDAQTNVNGGFYPTPPLEMLSSSLPSRTHSSTSPNSDDSWINDTNASIDASTYLWDGTTNTETTNAMFDIALDESSVSFLDHTFVPDGTSVQSLFDGHIVDDVNSKPYASHLASATSVKAAPNVFTPPNTLSHLSSQPSYLQPKHVTTKPHPHPSYPQPNAHPLSLPRTNLHPHTNSNLNDPSPIPPHTNAYSCPLTQLPQPTKETQVTQPTQSPPPLPSPFPAHSSRQPRLLLDPDPPALLILGYWFNLIAHLPHWWIRGRGRGECIAILGWLRSFINSDRWTGGCEGEEEGTCSLSCSRSCSGAGLDKGLFECAVGEFGRVVERDKDERRRAREDGV